MSSPQQAARRYDLRQILPPGSDPDEFFQLLDQFRKRFQPFDEVEDALVERLAAAEFKMRTVRFLDAGLFHYQTETSPIPEEYNKEDRTNPLAWAFHADSTRYNSFSKLMRYESFLQREFSRALRELFILRDDHRIRLAEDEAPASRGERRTKWKPRAGSTPRSPSNPFIGERGDPPAR